MHYQEDYLTNYLDNIEKKSYLLFIITIQSEVNTEVIYRTWMSLTLWFKQCKKSYRHPVVFKALSRTDTFTIQ